MGSDDKLKICYGGVQIRWEIEPEAPLPPSIKSLPTRVLQSRAKDAWRAAGRLQCLAKLWPMFLYMGYRCFRVDPEIARQIWKRFPELEEMEAVLETIAAMVQFPEEMREELAVFDRENGLRRECGNPLLRTIPSKSLYKHFQSIVETLEKILKTEALCLKRLDVNVEQFRSPWDTIERMIRGFVGVGADLRLETPKIEFGLTLTRKSFQEGRTFLLRGAEQLLQLLREYPETALERSVQSNVFKSGHRSRGGLPKDEANVRVREYLRKHPEASSEKIASEVGCSPSQVRKSASWKAVSEEKRKHKSITVRAGDCSKRDFEKAEASNARDRYREDEEINIAHLDGVKSTDTADKQLRQRISALPPPIVSKITEEEELANLIAEQDKDRIASSRRPKRKRNR